VRLVTSLGMINLELRSDLVPKTAHNFLLLCQKGYYTGTKFHRLIKGFMMQVIVFLVIRLHLHSLTVAVQGGDPTATGSGGKSAWGAAFPDDIQPTLKHDKRGVLSMANSGPNSNGSQFFITFAPKPSLDGKHTVRTTFPAKNDLRQSTQCSGVWQRGGRPGHACASGDHIVRSQRRECPCA
jgi:cyclophilin family peptidyl-prolyl cis-trans isomerase